MTVFETHPVGTGKLVRRWISVEERLPQEGATVWCYVFEDWPQQRGTYVRTDQYSDGPVHIFKNDWERFIVVTHWMPLPEPPEALLEEGE